MILDLACETGLVSLRAAAEAGTTGKVVAVDISSVMLEVARRKEVQPASSDITWVEGDIGNVGNSRCMRQVLQERDGGFVLIMCCSSFGYLADRAGAVKWWFDPLRPGGKMILDVSTEDTTVQFISGTVFRDIIKIGVPFDCG